MALLHRDDEVEIYAVSWMLGHDTGFYDHDYSSAVISVVSGAVSEERLALGGAVSVTVGAGQSITVARAAIHRVRHAGDGPALTLHAYSPPLRRVGTYEVAENGALLRHPRPSDETLEASAPTTSGSSLTPRQSASSAVRDHGRHGRPSVTVAADHGAPLDRGQIGVHSQAGGSLQLIVVGGQVGS